LCDLEACREYRIGTRHGHGTGLGPLEPAEGLTNAHHLFKCRCHLRDPPLPSHHCAVTTGKGPHQAVPGFRSCTRRSCRSLGTSMVDMLGAIASEGLSMKWQVGDVSITKIVELETTGGSRFILPQATREAVLPIVWLIPHFADESGRLKMSIHALIVEAPGRRIIVDTCLGNDKKERRIPTWNDRRAPFVQDLGAAGFARETIDTALCTHLHGDPRGW